MKSGRETALKFSGRSRQIRFEGSGHLGKIDKYELLYIKIISALAPLGIIYVYLFYYTDKSPDRADYNIIIDIVFLFTILLINFVKYLFIKSRRFDGKYVYIAFRALELMVIAASASFIIVDIWAFVAVVIILMVTTLCKGTRISVWLITYSAVIHVLFKMLRDSWVYRGFNLLQFFISRGFVLNSFYYLAAVLFTLFCGMIYAEALKREEEKKNLIAELEDKYGQLSTAQDEIKRQYEALKETNFKLEETNKKLAGSVAEFYTVQKISEAISSIFDIKELLRYVNDIILGVMGVNFCTIILYDEKRKRLRVHNTNIKEQSDLITLNDNVNCDLLLETLSSGKPIIENFVDPDDYAFTKGRRVNSMVCVPLTTKTRRFGLVLIEHHYYNAFDEGNVRLLDIISQQVAIAMENAELYQKMHELATIDGLTGVYNRLYFQQKLSEEFERSRYENYKLSLAIFDIDHFKKFNDTFGHLFGDKVLKQIASYVKGTLRSSDVIARFGGEEFIILFPRTGIQEAREKLEGLRRDIAELQIKDGDISASVTVSIGIACSPDTSHTENLLLRDADDALYQAKYSGRNCVMTAADRIASGTDMI